MAIVNLNTVGTGALGNLSGLFTPAPQLTASQNQGPSGANISGSVWGSTIPISMGYRMVQGVVLWAGPETKVNQRTVVIPPVPLATGIATPSQVNSSWDITRPFIVGVGERLNPADSAPQIRRIWVDGKLAYSNGSDQPLTWNNVQEAYLPTGQYINGVWVSVDGSSSPGFDTFTFNAGGNIPNSPPTASAVSNISFRFYTGTEAQLPDKAVVADLGDDALAYRGQMYLVIEGLIFGSGSSFTTDLSQFGADNVNSQIVTNSFPQVNVELVDTGISAVAARDFTMAPDAASTQFAFGAIMSDFANRRLAAVIPHSGSLNELWVADMDSTTQILNVNIVNPDGDQIGPPNGGFATWDTLNNIIYVGRSENLWMLSLSSSDGSIIDTTAITVNPNLAPFSAGGTITDVNPAIGFPRPQIGWVDYVVQGGKLQSLVAVAGNTWVGILAPIAGNLPDSLIPRSFYAADATSFASVTSMQSLKLFDDAVTIDHLSYQDACFVITSAAGVELVYVTVQAFGTGIVAAVLGRKIIHTVTQTGAGLHSAVDGDGNIVIQETKTAANIFHSKILINRNAAVDFTVAPGWRGNFPAVTGYAYHDVNPGNTSVWNGITLQNADLSANTYASGGDIVDLNTGLVSNLSGFSTFSSDPEVWDGPNSLRYFYGSITSTPAQVFSGTGLRYVQVINGLNGSVQTIGQVVKDIAEFVGYESGKVTVAASLTDEVPGVLITKPYDISALYGAAGALYDFTFRDSGDKLEFDSATNSPTYAIGGWTTTGVIADGDTATIGSSVYRFKTTPSAPFDVKISADDTVSGIAQGNAKEKTAANFLAALNADLTLAAPDSQNPAAAPGFFAGTVKNSQVVATPAVSSVDNFGFVTISFTAVLGGTGGNAIATTTTGSHASCTHTTLIDGAAPPVPSVSLTVADLALVSENQLTQNDAIVTTIQPEGAGQQAATIDYFALEQNYLPLAQSFIPDDQGGTLTVNGASTVIYDVPFVMSTSEAYARVAKTSFEQAQNVIVQNFRLSQKFLTLEPSDIINVTIGPFVYQLRLDECTFNGDWSTSYSAVNYSVRKDFTITDSDVAALPQSVPVGSDCLPLVIDAPIFNPKGGSVAGSFNLLDSVRPLTTRFSEATLSYGIGTNAPNQLYDLLTVAKWGNLAAAMPAATQPYYRTTTDSITIICKSILPAADLQSAASYVDFVAGVNCLAIGQPGNWEFVFFNSVTVINSQTVRLDGLIRAQRGTDAAVNGHTVSDYVVLIASANPSFAGNALKTQSLPSSAAGTAFNYYAAGIPSSRAPTSLAVSPKGLTLYPWSPCRLKVTLSSTDLVITWVRRDRLSAAFVTVATPMSETAEKYDLDIFNAAGTAVIRTETDLTSPTYTFLAAQQTADGLTPGSVATLKVAVYQKGELGRGFARTETLNVH